MITGFDRIVIAVPDLGRAIKEYQTLLQGAKFWHAPTTDGEPTAWMGLANVVLELREQRISKPAIIGLIFQGDHPESSVAEVINTRQLKLGFCDGGLTGDFRRSQLKAQNPQFGVDHVVLRTANAGACVDLFAVGLGIRLALDQNVPEWGGRMLFFRTGKLTLEVIETADELPETDYFWGITYHCGDIAATVNSLREHTVQVSDIRDGRRPGTQVATIKSHALGIPTLLIQAVKP